MRRGRLNGWLAANRRAEENLWTTVFRLKPSLSMEQLRNMRHNPPERHVLFALGCLLAATLFAGSGCATVTRGSKDVLVIESDPPNAEVKLSTGEAGTTPTSFKLPRRSSLVATISKPGYETVTVNVNSVVAGGGAAGMAGNVLLGGIIGAAVDGASGAALNLSPNPIDVTLEPVAEAEGVGLVSEDSGLKNPPKLPPDPSPKGTPAPIPEEPSVPVWQVKLSDYDPDTELVVLERDESMPDMGDDVFALREGSERVAILSVVEEYPGLIVAEVVRDEGIADREKGIVLVVD